jgi:ElaB/YqjD/DUF883 family membrane-anchored ribosome-binding protein
MEQQQTLGDKTRQVTSQAQQKAGEQVRTGIDTGKRRAADALHGVAESLLHGTGDDAAEGVTRYIQQAGEQVRRAADWLENTNVDELTRRTEDFARRQPAVFIGGAFTLGLIAARFFKSSSRDQQEKLYKNRFTPAPLADAPLGTGYTGMNAGAGDLSASGYGDPAARTGEQVYRDGGL